jgi:hypothetical protein
MVEGGRSKNGIHMREARQQGPEGSRGLPALPVLVHWVVVCAAVGSCIALGVASVGCVATTSAPPSRAIIVSGPPPAPIVEEPTLPPHAQAMWIAGYWHWTGIQYAWIPGHWEEAPPKGSTWRAPRYVSADGAYFYEPGRWWTEPSGVPAAPPGANAFH